MIIDFIDAYPFLIAFLLGLIPALVWLWFWLKEDTHPEPAKMITLSFLGGMAAVILVLPLQQVVYDYVKVQNTLSFTLWAALEELFKFLFVYFIALRRKCTDEPVDDIIYLIISALGFVTAENTLFLFAPLKNGDFIDTIVSGNLRFIGASLLHIMASGTLGICLGLSFRKNRATRIRYGVIGIILAIALHTIFNLFISNGAGGNIFFTFGLVWVGIIVLLLMFEKVKKV